VIERLVDLALLTLRSENHVVQRRELVGRCQQLPQIHEDALTLFPFWISARSHALTSLAYVLKSRTWLSRSVVHFVTISSTVLPRSIDGGFAAAEVAVVAVARSNQAQLLSIHDTD
jgi:hypothetical protein